MPAPDLPGVAGPSTSEPAAKKLKGSPGKKRKRQAVGSDAEDIDLEAPSNGSSSEFQLDSGDERALFAADLRERFPGHSDHDDDQIKK